MPSSFPPIADFGLIADVGFPSRICSSLFLVGCNFRCPFCINAELATWNDKRRVDLHQVLLRLRLRKEISVVVTGAEPFCHNNIMNLLEKIKSYGIRAIVATNGAYPEKIEEASERKLLDHVIMDVKTRLDRHSYSKAVGIKLSDEKFCAIMRSIDLLKEGLWCRPTSEFRTTVCSKFVSKNDVFSIAKHLGKRAIYFLQPFTTHQTLDPSMANDDFIVPFEELKEWAKEIESEKIVFAAMAREV